MQENENKVISGVLNADHLARIEAVHRGFLYQHLYAVGCFLFAKNAGVKAVMVELDEDIELETEKGWVYVQVKTRSKPIIPSDVSDALERFYNFREMHIKKRSKGGVSFVIVANQVPSAELQRTIKGKKFPIDALFLFPQSPHDLHPSLPPAWESLADAVAWCIAEAEKLNFSLLSPNSLIWKLAGLVQLAATVNTGLFCPHFIRGNFLQIQPRDKLLHGLGALEVRRTQAAVELDATAGAVPHLGHFDRQVSKPGLHCPFWPVSVAHDGLFAIHTGG